MTTTVTNDNRQHPFLQLRKEAYFEILVEAVITKIQTAYSNIIVGRTTILVSGRMVKNLYYGADTHHVVHEIVAFPLFCPRYSSAIKTERIAWRLSKY
jgi:hypothetical protein